jgi:tRNA-dihydrouridine synthase
MSKLGTFHTYLQVKMRIVKPDRDSLVRKVGTACPTPADYLMVHVRMTQRLSIHFHLLVVLPLPSD